MQVPETDRTWTMRGEPVQLPAAQLQRYRGIIAAFQRKQQNTGEADGRKLYTELECFLREVYEGREEGPASYASTSVMGGLSSAGALSLSLQLFVCFTCGH